MFHALNGGRDKLSQRDLTFVGVDVWPITTPGWRSPTGLYLDDPLEGFGLSAEDSAALHAIMMVGSQGGLEIPGLGGALECHSPPDSPQDRAWYRRLHSARWH